MKYLFALALFFLVIVPSSHAQDTFKVLKVVDGDTITVNVRGNKETVRLLGIDTPETVDPRRAVQCFGKAASDKMKQFVSGKSVILVDDSTQGNRDKYNRLLRYVYLPDSVRTFVNGEMIKQGYAFSFKQYPTKMLTKFNAFEVYARTNKLGLWGACPISSPPAISPTKQTAKKIYIAPTAKQIIPTQKALQPAVQGAYTGGDKDCGDFSTHAQAQEFFISQGGPGSDSHKLDQDNDGQACETLP